MSNDRKKLPAPRGGNNKLAKRGGTAGAGNFLDKVRNAKAAPPRLKHAAETVDPALVAGRAQAARHPAAAGVRDRCHRLP